MARTDYPVAGEEFIITIPLTPAGGGDNFQSAPTIAVADFKIIENSLFVNLDNTPTVVDGEVVRILVSATETQDVFDDGEPLVILGRDASGAEWQDIFYSVGVQAAAIADASALATVDSNVDAVLVDTDTTIPALLAALNDPTAAAVATAVLAAETENSETVAETLRLVRAALLGKASGGGTTTITYRDAADSKDRITATVTQAGDRTAVVTDGT